MPESKIFFINTGSTNTAMWFFYWCSHIVVPLYQLNTAHRPAHMIYKSCSKIWFKFQYSNYKEDLKIKEKGQTKTSQAGIWTSGNFLYKNIYLYFGLMDAKISNFDKEQPVLMLSYYSLQFIVSQIFGGFSNESFQHSPLAYFKSTCRPFTLGWKGQSEYTGPNDDTIKTFWN